MKKVLSIVKDVIKKIALFLWFIIKLPFLFIRFAIKYLILFIWFIIKLPFLFIKFIKVRTNSKWFFLGSKGIRFIWKCIIFIVWDFSGVRYIITKIKPPFNKDEKLPTYRRPATFFLWIVGIYVALFGIASNRYENRADKIENRMNAIYAQIPKDMEVAFSRIDDVQNMVCPYKPNIFQPVSIIKSFKFVVTSDEYQKLIEEKKSSKIATWFFKHFYLVDIKYDDGIEQLKQLVEDWAQKTKVIKGKEVGELYGFDLNGVHLEKANFERANLKNVSLIKANLKNANLWEANLENACLAGSNLANAWFLSANLKNVNLERANLKNANLWKANLENADLWEAYLENTNLWRSDFENANLRDANFKNALFCNADLKNAKTLTAEQLSKVFSLWGVKNLDTKLKEKVKKINPKLFEPNYEVYECNDEGKGLLWREYLKEQKK